MLIREQGVATKRGRLESVQNRPKRRTLQERHVRVPAATEVDRLLWLLNDLHYLWVCLETANVRMGFERTEPLGKTLLLLDRQVLLSEDHDVMLEKELFDRLELGRAEIR